MKKKIPTDILIQIEDVIEEEKETGVFRYTRISHIKNKYDSDTDMVARAIDLAHMMPFKAIQTAIEEYDNSHPKMDELQFVSDLCKRYSARRIDVIDRIQYVRRILKRRREEQEAQLQGVENKMYKQVIVVNKELSLSRGKFGAQVSHASMAFLTRMIQNHSRMIHPHRYAAVDTTRDETRPALYKRKDLYDWAKEAFERGDKFFYAKPVDPNDPYGELELCEPTHEYMVEMRVDADLYEQWMGGSFTKVILEAKNEEHMKKIVNKAIEAGMIENEDFFCIRDNCLTELTPDETGTRWTCIGFRPMSSEQIDVVTKRLQLYKD